LESNEVWACGTADVVVGFPQYSLKEVLEVLHTNKFRRLPIVGEEHELEGIVVIADIIRWLQSGTVDVEKKVPTIMTKELVTIEASETLETATRAMRENNIGCLPIVREGNKLVGIITERDILNFRGQPIECLNAPVSQFLRDDEFLTLQFESTVQETLNKLVEKDVRRVILVENDKLKGILTASDILDGFITEGEKIRQKPVSGLATLEVLFVTPKTPVSAAIALMRQESIGQVPVVDDGYIAGVFTERDILLMLAAM